ncbi:MAG: 6-hydroxymethylpterin diphosphokinase MptE-like protein [Spirochaetia bacterium]
MQEQAPLLTEVSGGTSIVFKNKELYSRHAPRQRAEERAGGFSLEANTLYILASPLLWYGVPRLLEQLPPSAHIIAVEIEPQLVELSRRYVRPELTRHHRLHICFQESSANSASASSNASSNTSTGQGTAPLEAVKAVLDQLGIEQFRRARLITLNGGYRLNSRRYSEIHQLLEEEIHQFWQNKYTLMHMLPLWIKNIFRNYAEWAGDGAARRVRFGLPHTTLPVMVAGAGPSLEQHLEFLQQHRSRFYLLAVDTAYSTLLASGIHPDLVVVQESQFYNLYDFLGHPRLDCNLLADISSYPRVLRLAGEHGSRSTVFLYASEFAKVSLLDKLRSADLLPPLFPPLGSVGTTAVRAALHISGSAVIIAGLDFAFPAGKTHSNGTPRHQLALLHTNRLQGIEDMSARSTKGVTPVPGRTDSFGEQLLSAPTLRRYADNFTRIFQSMERMHMLKPAGLPLGIAGLTQADLSRYLLALEPPPGKAAASAPTLAEKAGPGAVKAFLSKERERLVWIYKRGTGFLQGELTADEAALLTEEINCCEYLFLHFPETGYTLRKVDPTLMKRLLVSTGHYIRVIDEALELIPRS